MINKNWSALKRLLFLKAGSGGSSGGWRTVTGAIASFIATKAEPLKMQFDLLPIQNLNGQANPYPPGGGKNLLPMTVDNLKTFNTNGTWNGNVYTYRNVTYTLNTDDGGNVESITVNGTATYISSLILATNIGASFVVDTQYALTGCPSGGSASGGYNLTIGVSPDTTRMAYDTGSGVTFTYQSSYQSYTYNAYIAVAQGVSISSKIFTPMVRLASTPSGFAPYSNICPISGHDGFTRTGAGKNIFGGMPLAEMIRDHSYNHDAIDTVNKIVSFTNAMKGDNYYRETLFDKFKPNKQYTVIITAQLQETGKNNSLILRYSDDTHLSINIEQTQKTTYVFTSNASKSVVSMQMSFYGNKLCDVYYEESGIFEGVLTASDFEAYTGTSYNNKFFTNLFDKSTATLDWRLSTTGQPYADGNCFISYPPYAVEVGKTYVKNSPTADAYHRFCTYDSSNNFVRKVDDSNSITIQSGEAYLRFCGYKTELDSTIFYEDVGIPGTVYGCRFSDNGDGTGTMVVTRAMVGGSAWEQHNQSNGFKAYRINNVPAPNAVSATTMSALSNMIGKFGSFNSSSMTKNIIQLPTPTAPNVYMALQEDVSASDVWLTYLLGTPIVYTLSIDAIQSLIGQNNVWVDNADEVTVEYWGH